MKSVLCPNLIKILPVLVSPRVIIVYEPGNRRALFPAIIRSSTRRSTSQSQHLKNRQCILSTTVLEKKSKNKNAHTDYRTNCRSRDGSEHRRLSCSRKHFFKIPPLLPPPFEPQRLSSRNRNKLRATFGTRSSRLSRRVGKSRSVHARMLTARRSLATRRRAGGETQGTGPPNRISKE